MNIIILIYLVFLVSCEEKHAKKKDYKSHKLTKSNYVLPPSSKCEVYCLIQSLSDTTTANPNNSTTIATKTTKKPNPSKKPTKKPNYNSSVSTTTLKSRRNRKASHKSRIHYISRKKFDKLSKTHYKLPRNKKGNIERNFPPTCKVFCERVVNLGPLVQPYDYNNYNNYIYDDDNSGYYEENINYQPYNYYAYNLQEEDNADDDYEDDQYIPGEDDPIEITEAPDPNSNPVFVGLEDFGVDGNPAMSSWFRKLEETKPKQRARHATISRGKKAKERR